MATRRRKTPPMNPGALHAGPLAPPRHDTDARSHCSEARIAHAPSDTTPAGQYTANETGACLGWILDWRNARPCLVGVAVGNLPAGKGRAESKQRNRIDQQGCSAALGLGMQARCASMQAAACGPNRPTQIYNPPTRETHATQATAISLCQPGPPLGEATSLLDTVVATTVTQLAPPTMILTFAARSTRTTCHSPHSLTYTTNLSSRRRKPRADTWEPKMPA